LVHTHSVHRATLWAGAFLIFVQQIRIPIGQDSRMAGPSPLGPKFPSPVKPSLSLDNREVTAVDSLRMDRVPCSYCWGGTSDTRIGNRSLRPFLPARVSRTGQTDTSDTPQSGGHLNRVVGGIRSGSPVEFSKKNSMHRSNVCTRPAHTFCLPPGFDCLRLPSAS